MKNVLLWILQVLLAALFLFSGVMKFMMPKEILMKNSPFPLAFILFIGVCEIAGGLGLILPAATRIKPALTPIASACLAIIMVGATITTVVTMNAKNAVLPFIALLLTAFVAYGRWKLAPIAPRTAAKLTAVPAP